MCIRDRDDEESLSLSLFGPDQVSVGDNFCVDIVFPTVFDIQFLQLPISYNSDAFQYEPELCIESIVLTGFNCTTNVVPSDLGEIRLFWFHPFNQSDDVFEGDAIVSLCFQAIGPTENGIITIQDEVGRFAFEIGITNDSPVPTSIQDVSFESLSVAVEGTEMDQAQGLPIADYPWMEQLVAEFDCASLIVQEYISSVFSFFYFVDDTQSRLFFQDGTPYCTATPTFDCLEIYGLNANNLENEWACSGETTSSTDSSSISGRVTDTRGLPIEGALVSIVEGDFANTSAVTNSEGFYAFNLDLSLIHISEPTRRYAISYAVFCLKKKN